MKKFLLAFLLLVLLIQCTKEKRFENGIHGNWDIDLYELYSVYSTSCGGQGPQLLDSKENFGSIEFTTKKYPNKVAYSVTDQQYIGYWTDENGNESEFAYEYFEKVFGGFSLTIFKGGLTYVYFEILTKKIWKFYTVNVYDDCTYDLYKYELTK